MGYIALILANQIRGIFRVNNKIIKTMKSWKVRNVETFMKYYVAFFTEVTPVYVYIYMHFIYTHIYIYVTPSEIRVFQWVPENMEVSHP